MLRRPLLIALFALCAALAWLAASDSGLRSAARLAEGASGGRLTLDNPAGRLLGPLSIERLRWQAQGLTVEISHLSLDWSPAGLLRGHWQVDDLRAERLLIDSPPDPTPNRLPADLTLPVTVDGKNVQISQIAWAGRPAINDLQARLRSNGQSHHLDLLQARLADTAVTLRGSLAGRAPFALDATGEIAGQLEQRPLAMQFRLQGPLERIALQATATQGVQGHATATLTPFAEAAFANARLQLAALDPAAWLAGAPQARIDLVADLQPDGQNLIGSFGLTNQQPGPLDRQRLPLATLAGTLAWQDSALQFRTLHASQPRQGTLSGNGRWQDDALHLALTARQLDVAQIVSALHATRLDGKLEATLAAARQDFQIDLKDSQYALQATGRQSDGRIALDKLLLSAGEARLLAEASLDLAAPRRFAATGELARFDPSRFGRLPKAELNARLNASGQLLPQPVIEAGFRLGESRLAGQPLNGEGQVSVAWPHIPQLDITLSAGPNRLNASGAFGRPGDRLNLSIAAPQLAPYGLAGGLDGQASLSGDPGHAQLTATLNAERLALPGSVSLDGLKLRAELGNAPDTPWAIDLRIASLAAGTQQARQLRLQTTGTTRAHQLQAQAELGRDTLSLAAEGQLDAARPGWQGQLTALAVDSPQAARNLRLSAAAPLQLDGRGWRLGPARLAGAPLDWQAELFAEADGRQATATLAARGSRIGMLSGEWRAGQLTAWTLDRRAPWQGRLQADIADLGWAAELLGDGWRSAGRLHGDIRLAGTPERPTLNGSARGDQLALAQAEQGLKLANGELDIDLRDNTLRINRLGFDSVLRPAPRALRLVEDDTAARLDERPGRLEITGETRLAADLGADQAKLEIRLERVGVFQQPEQWVAVSGGGQLLWQAGLLGARGKLTVDAGYWQLAPMGTPRLSDDVVVRRPGSEAPAANPLRPRLEIDIETDLGRNFIFSGAGLNSRLAGALRIQAKGRDLPRASGTIRTRGGRFDAYGQKLEIERGILSFNGLLDNPGLDVRAVRKGLAVEPGVQIAGTAQKPVVRLISDPELPDAEKLTWLVLGHGPEQTSAGDATVLLSAAGGLLGNDAGSVMQQVKRTFGLDEFGLRQGNIGDSGGRLPSSRVAGSHSVDTSGTTGQQIVSLGKRLSSNALLSYEQSLGKAEGIVKLTVNLNRQLSVIGRAGSDNALDLFYTLTFGRAEEKPVGK